MTGKTHIQFAFCCSAIANVINPITDWKTATCYIIISGVASTFPDLDSETSWASQALFGIDDTLRKLKIFKHRGITHFNFKFTFLRKFLLKCKKQVEKRLNKSRILFTPFLYLELLTYNILLLFQSMLKPIIRYLLVTIVLTYGIFLEQNVLIKAICVGYCSHIIIDYLMVYIGIKTGSDIENKIIYRFFGFCSILSFMYIYSLTFI